MSALSHRIYGQGNEVIYILHGIFGMKDNWHFIAGQLADDYTVVTLDARNHGKSFHSFEMSYTHMADDLAGLMEHLGHTEAHVLGHSMGGKTAMTFSTLYPEKLKSLMVVDIATRGYAPGHMPYFQAFETIDFTILQSRSEAEQAFMPYAPDAAVRQFLIKNLEPIPGGGYQPRFNLPAIKAFYPESIGPLNLPTPVRVSCNVEFIRGADSHYVKDTDIDTIRLSYPNAVFHTIANAGHWVHADNPQAFLNLVRQLIGN